MRKNKLLHKAAAVLLAASMVLSATGCKSKAPEAGAVQSTGTGSAAGGNGDTAAADEAVDSSEPYTITWAYIGATYQDTDLVEEEMNKILQPKFNCTIDIIGFSWGEYTQKLNLMLSGEEPLDMVPVIYGNGASYLNNGQIIDMKELIDKYGKNMKEVVGEDTLYVCNVGGKIYGVPVFKEYSVDAAVMLRKDLLEEAGFSVDDIHSIDDLGPVYEKVKEKHPEMVMLAGRKGETPAVAALWCDNLSDGFGVIMPEDKEGKVVNYYESEQFKHNAEVIYEYARKGYLSKDCATMNDGKKPQVKAGTAFSYFTPTKPGVELQDSLDTGYEMVYAPLTSTFRATSQMAWIGWGIGKNCKYPERVMQVLDYMYASPELMNLFNWGIEGRHYVFADEEKGIITYPEGVNVQNKTYGLNMGYEMPNQTIAYVWEGNEPSVWEEYRKFNSAEPLISTGFIFDNSNVLTEISALTNVRDKYIDAIGSGAVDPAAAIPEMNEALKNAGLDKVIQEKQAQLDAFIASK